MSITAIATALQTCITPIAALGGRVFINRERAYAAHDLPCVEIKFTGENPERNAEHYQTWDANFSISVCVKAAEADRPDITAEGLYQQVKAHLYANMTLGDVVPKEIEFSAGRSDADAAGEVVVRKLVLDISCRYIDELYGPASDALGTVAVDIDMANPRNSPATPYGPDGQIDAQARIALPT